MRCPFCHAPVPKGGRFCPSCGQRVEEVRESFVPVTVLYVDLSGYTRLVQDRSPEEVAEIMEGFFRIVEEEVNRTGGFLYQRLGDGALCIFGYPHPLEDEAERALMTCCALKDRMGELPEGLSVHGGVATGKVLVVSGREVRFVGTPMNLAARLQDLAPPGTFLVDETTYRLTHHAYTLTPAGEISLQGLDSQRIYALQSVREQGLTWRKENLPRDVFVGRTRELLDLLSSREHFLQNPQPHVIRIIGEPGVGKTRLVVEFLKTLSPDERVVIARALPYGMPPFGPLIYALRRLSSSEKVGERTHNPLFQAAPSALVEIQKALSPEMLLAPDEAFRIFLQTYRELLTRPTLFILEDAQWADTFTHRVITTLLRQGLPVFLILIARKPLREDTIWRETLQEMEREFPALVFRLRPLSPEDVRTWWEAVWGTRLSEERLQSILKLTGGFPLLLEEYARHLQERPDDPTPPRHLEELFLSRISRLPPESQTLLDTASLVGQIFFREPLEQALAWDRDTFEKALSPLLAQNLVIRRTVRQREDWEELAFRHILLQETVFRSLPRTRRRELARKLLRVFQQEEVPTLQHTQMLARFACFAEDAVQFRDALFRTIQSFSAAGAWRELLDFLDEFPDLDRLLSQEDLGEIGTYRAEAWLEMGDHQAARTQLEQNRELLGEKPRDQILLGTLLEHESRYEEALNVLERIQTTDLSEERERLQEMIWVNYLMGRFEEVERLWEVCNALPPPEHPLDRARLLNLRANTLPEKRGKTIFALRREVLEIALAHGYASMEMTIRNNMAGLAVRGHIGEALLHLERSLELARKIGNPLGEAITLYNLGEIHSTIGAFQEAHAHLDAYLSLSARIHNRLGFVYGHFVKGMLAREEGDLQEALHHFQQASSWAHRLQSDALRAMVLFAYAWLLLEMDRAAGGELARWAWPRWDAFEQTFFLWRWGEHPAVQRWAPHPRPGVEDLLRASFPHLAWNTWLDWLLEVMEREPTWRPRLLWKARLIARFVQANTPESLRHHLEHHPRYGSLL